MFIHEVTIANLGPFFKKTTIKLDHPCTAITGRNDVGKSWVFRCLRSLIEGSRMDASCVNKVFASHGGGDSKDIDDVFVQIEFQRKTIVQTNNGNYDFKSGGPIRYNPITGDYKIGGAHIQNDQVGRKLGIEIATLPSDLKINSGEVSFKELTDLMKSAIRSSTRVDLSLLFNPSTNIDVAEDLFETLQEDFEYWTRDLVLKGTNLHLRWKDAKARTFSVYCQDQDKKRIPLENRSTGFQRALAQSLWIKDQLTAHRNQLILADEPGISLHADAQHDLVRSLESLCEYDSKGGGSRQCLYITHSPSMLNPAKPTSIKLLTQATFRPQNRRNNEYRYSKLETRALKGTFQLVRSSLGITHRDTLMYSPISVVGEGETELVALSAIVDRLKTLDQTLWEKIEPHIPKLGFVDGLGTNLPKYCTFVSSLGYTVIALVDGDVADRERRKLVPNILTEEDFFALPDRKEFEEGVSSETYINTLLNTYKITEATFADFESYMNGTGKRYERKAFSKRVYQWVEHLNDTREREDQIRYNKPEVMRAVIENLEELDDFGFAEQIRQLVDRIVVHATAEQ